MQTNLNIFKYQRSEFEGIYLIENLEHTGLQKKVCVCEGGETTDCS